MQSIKNLTAEEVKALYESYIPKHCALQTYEEHASELMYCWGITARIYGKSPKPMQCGVCEMNTSFPESEREIFWEKEKVWRLLNEE